MDRMPEYLSAEVEEVQVDTDAQVASLPDNEEPMVD